MLVCGKAAPVTGDVNVEGGGPKKLHLRELKRQIKVAKETNRLFNFIDLINDNSFEI